MCGQRRSAEDAYMHLARYALEGYIKTGKMPEIPAGICDEMLLNKAGVFVCVKIGGSLRGCIGTIDPVRPCVAEEILHNAVSAGTRDPRFPQVTKRELQDLAYSVDVLTAPEPIESTDDLDVKRYGLILETPQKRGVLLPDLDGVDTIEDQIAVVKSKAGIRDGESYSMFRFEVIRHQ